MPTAGIAPYNMIAIVNQSTAMNDTDGGAIVAALNMVIPVFCNDWNIPPVVATYVKRNTTTKIPLCCYILDTSDVEDALGYHDESLGIPYGKVFVKTIQKYGGVILYSSNSAIQTVSGTVCHEVLEMIGDLHANVWWASADRMTLYAGEVCDPVQGNIVNVQPKGLSIITMSDWILPSWAEPQSVVGPFNHTKTLTAPMTVDKSGYLITMKSGNSELVFGSEVSDLRKKTMHVHPRLRISKLKNTTVPAMKG
jgi:hypothetical protein